MSHPVKCYYCGERFDRDWEPYVKVNAQRYAHKKCADEHEREQPTPVPKSRPIVKTPVKKNKEEEQPMLAANNDMLKLLENMQTAMMKSFVSTNVETIFESLKPQLEERIKKAYGVLPEIHEIRTETTTKEIVGCTHEKFDEVLQIVGLNIPVYLTGKAGTGKNVICKQVAEALGLEFYFTNAVTQEYKLTGFVDANGKYHETQFYKAFTNGGLFFLDEMDASVPETLIILNAAIANKYFDFPTGKVEAHPDFRVIAAGNTLGTGADNNYTGRYCLDRASLDRFAMVHIDYSEKIEMNISDNNKELVDFAHTFRTAAENVGVECLFSYRTIERIAKLETVLKDNLASVIEMSLTKGLGQDDILIICNEIKKIKSTMKSNKYLNALAVRAF